MSIREYLDRYGSIFMKNNNSGFNKMSAFSTIEIIVTLAISISLIKIAAFNYLKYKEFNSLNSAKVKIVNSISKYRDLAYYNNKSYKIDFNFLEKSLSIKNFSGKKIFDTNLPDDLKYKIINKNYTPSYFSTNITPNGNLGDAFTIYIFNYEDIPIYRIGFYTFSQIKFLAINVYKNYSVKNANYSNIYTYHYSTESQNHVGWIKEQ